jgi:hypothetical protein
VVLDTLGPFLHRDWDCEPQPFPRAWRPVRVLEAPDGLAFVGAFHGVYPDQQWNTAPVSRLAPALALIGAVLGGTLAHEDALGWGPWAFLGGLLGLLLGLVLVAAVLILEDFVRGPLLRAENRRLPVTVRALRDALVVEVPGGEARVSWSPEAVVLVEPVFDGEVTCEFLAPQWREVGVRTGTGEFWSLLQEEALPCRRVVVPGLRDRPPGLAAPAPPEGDRMATRASHLATSLRLPARRREVHFFEEEATRDFLVRQLDVQEAPI